MKDERDENLGGAEHETSPGAADPYGAPGDELDPRAEEAETQRLLEIQHNLEQAEGDDQEEG
jgi:hypothetical protein